jgi:hypothetical protein
MLKTRMDATMKTLHLRVSTSPPHAQTILSNQLRWKTDSSFQLPGLFVDSYPEIEDAAMWLAIIAASASVNYLGPISGRSAGIPPCAEEAITSPQISLSSLTNS